MSRSYKKIAAGTNCVCKSQKVGKRLCNRLFRKRSKRYMRFLDIDRLPYRTIEIIDTWSLGGDGKRIYKSDDEELLKRLKRK